MCSALKLVEHVGATGERVGFAPLAVYPACGFQHARGLRSSFSACGLGMGTLAPSENRLWQDTCTGDGLQHSCLETVGQLCLSFLVVQSWVLTEQSEPGSLSEQRRTAKGSCDRCKDDAPHTQLSNSVLAPRFPADDLDLCAEHSRLLDFGCFQTGTCDKQHHSGPMSHVWDVSQPQSALDCFSGHVPKFESWNRPKRSNLIASGVGCCRHSSDEQ